MRKVIFAALLAIVLPIFTFCGTSGGSASIAQCPSEIRADDPVVIRFNSPLVEKSNSALAELAKSAITVSPGVDFDAEVVDIQTICLYPKEKLEYNATYKVTVNAAKLTGEKGKETFEVHTLAPVLVFDFGQLKADPENEGIYSLQVGFDSSEPLDPKYVEENFSVKGASASPTWSHSPDGLKHSAMIYGIAAAKTPSKVEVAYNYPKYSAEGKRSYQLPAAGDFTVIGSENFSDPYSYVLTFSALIDKAQNFAELVSMPGAGKLSFSVDRNVLTIKPSLRNTEKQFMSVSKAIRSVKGSKLAEDFERYFAIPSGEPEIAFLSSGSVLPSSGIPVAFRSINYARAEVRVKQIYESNVLQFLQDNKLDDRYCYTGDVARTVLDTTLVLGDVNSPALRNMNIYGLDVTNLLKLQRGAIYRIEIKGVDPLVEFNEDRWESDYWFGSYDDYDDRVRNILVSDLNVIAKASDEGAFTIFVTDIMTATPVSGAKVSVYNDVNQLIEEGTTNPDGCLESSRQKDSPRTVVVTNGQDRSYLSLRGGTEISLSNFDVSGTASRDGQRGFIFGERGVWRPGDDIYLTFVSKLDKGTLPAGHPVTAVLRNPQGQIMETVVSNEGHDGMYAFHFKTDEAAPTGNWTAEITAGGQTWSKTVKIETVKPNNIVINLSLNDDPAIPASSLRGDIAAKWLVGNPAKGLETRVEVALGKASTAFKGYKDYVFEDPSRYFSGEEKELYRGVTDAEGKLHFNTSVGKSVNAPGFLSGVFTTRVFEHSGDFSIDRYTATVSPYDTYIGLKAPEAENSWGEKYLDKGRTHTFSLAALDYRGNAAQKGVKVEVEVYKMGWSWWWSSSSSELASYAKDSYNTPYKTFQTTVSGGQGSFTLDFSDQESGMFLVRATDLSGGHAAARVVMVTGRDDYMAAGGPESATRLQMALDKDKYVVGETANISIPSAAGTRALVSIEKGKRVIKSFWVNCKGDNTVIPVKIENGMSPNVYASVMLVQPYRSAANDAPIRLFGVTRIKIEDASTHLDPKVDIAAEVRPESEVTFTVKEASGRPMSYVVALVDEGLLSLTRYKTPNPWNIFYATEALGVRTWDLFDMVIGAYGARMERNFAIGGDADVQVTPNSKAERFKPVSLFLGPYTIKARATGKHTVKIPQYIGNLRVMVVSTDGTAMGCAEKSLAVVKPVMAQATLPRVIGTEEEITMPVTLFTTRDNVGKVNVEYSVEGPLTAVGEKTASTSIAKAGEEMVFFKLKSGVEEGIARINVTASGAGDVSKQTIEIDVRDPNPVTTNSASMLVEAGRKAAVDFVPVGKAGIATVKVEASSIPPVDLDYRLGYLTGYPHGCVEQTVSAVFPQLWLGDLIDLDSKGVKGCEENIKAAINKLPSFAIAGGGMTYWPGTSSYAGASQWGTIYSTHFMVEAKAKGYSVPASLLKNNIKYLKGVASDKASAANSRAYACYVLALYGEAPRGDMNRLREDLARIPVEAGWYLAAAYAVDGKKDVARTVISSIPSKGGDINRFSDTFESDERLMAVAAIACDACGNKAEAFKCIQTLSGWLNDRNHYMSTQSTAWALNAVSRYAAHNESDKMDVTVTAGSNKATLRSSSAVASAVLGKAATGQLKVEAANSSKAPVWVVVSSTGVPEKGEEVAKSNGLKLTVTYTLPDGTAINPTDLEQGTDFFVNVTLTNTSATRSYTNLALTQVFPAGWEFDRTRKDGLYQDFRDDRIYTYIYLPRNGSGTVRTKVTAAYAGSYYLPSTVCEAMYDNSVNASTAGCWCVVR
ncbi:MAG: alpha-2-macroglobulin [Bacteroidales bacterium]|nr:alpha-2-macroglobulin [Bacteroidales bacterium]